MLTYDRYDLRLDIIYMLSVLFCFVLCVQYHIKLGCCIRLCLLIHLLLIIV